MKRAEKSTTLVLDVLAVTGLLLFSGWIVFFSLLVGPGYWGPTISLLTNAGAVGAILHILSEYGESAKIMSIVLIAFAWVLGLSAVVFGFSSLNNFEIGVVLPKVIMFVYPILFLVGILKKKIGDILFKGATLLYIGCAAGILTLIISSIPLPFELTGASSIALAFLFILMFIVFYPLYRLFFVSGFTIRS